MENEAAAVMERSAHARAPVWLLPEQAEQWTQGFLGALALISHVVDEAEAGFPTGSRDLDMLNVELGHEQAFEAIREGLSELYGPADTRDNRIAALTRALERAEMILANMAMEHTTGWRGIFARWPIHHEPLRNDARRALPAIEAALRPVSP